MKQNILFICSRNQWRSPTAEKLLRDNQLYSVKSAGTSDKARIKVSEKLINWADIIFVMEKKHQALLRQKYNYLLNGKQIINLNIDDLYKFDDPELVEILKSSLAEYLSLDN